MSTRSFHVGDILSVISGRLLSLRGISGVEELLEFLENCDGVLELDIEILAKKHKPNLLKQFPELERYSNPNHALYFELEKLLKEHKDDSKLAMGIWFANFVDWLNLGISKYPYENLLHLEYSVKRD